MPTSPQESSANQDRDGSKLPISDGAIVSWRSRALHLFALSGFAIAQPLLGLLGGEPGFWIARSATYLDVGLLILVAVFAIPIVVLIVERLVAYISEKAAWIVHLLAVVGFAGLILLNVVDTVTGGEMRAQFVAGLAAGAAGVFAVLYARFSGLRDFVSVLAVGPILFVLLFVIGLPPLGGSESPTLDAGIESSTSVVLVVLDEFQLATMVNEDGSIDRTKYPNLGRLSDISTFYPNATTVHDNSLKSVPTILTGQYPRNDQQATAEDHPLSIFTVLGDRHEMVVNEDFTQVCPKSLCEESQSSVSTSKRLSTLASDSAIVYLHTVVPTRLRYRLPPIGTRWVGFLAPEAAVDVQEDARAGETKNDEAGRYEQEMIDLTGSERRAVDYGLFLDSLDSNLSPALYYLHVDLPHAPWSYTPSGKPYPYADHIPGYTPEGIWKDDPWYTQQAYERFILNSGFTDELVGKTLDRLEDLAMLDDVLLIFVSDHGENFGINESRRALTDETFAAIAGVPLFIKYPGQPTGNVDERSAQTIDVLPTIVDVLGGSIDGMDGVSLLVDDPPTTKRLLSNGGRAFVLSVDEYRFLADEYAAEAHAQLPMGVGYAGVVDAAGPRPDLNGRDLDDFEIVDVPGHVSVKTREFYANYDPGGLYDPIAIPADITVDEGDIPEFFAIVVNGVVETTITAYEINGDTATIYGIVPPDTYRRGPNEVEVLGIVGDGENTVLQRFS